jgi:signal peptidase I
MENSNTEEAQKTNKFPLLAKWDGFKSGLTPSVRIGVEALEFILTLLLLLIIIRQGVFERRYIPSESMLPNLQIGDQLIIEKVTKNLHALKIGSGLQRGDVVVFYPPPEANYGQDLKRDFPNAFVRLTGLSSDITIGKLPIFFFLPKAEDAYIKRVVGLPGEQVQVKAGDGVYINGHKLKEDYILEKPDYSLSALSDIPLLDGSQKSDKPIVVPDGYYMVFGDNRNNSNDGHIWGFVKKERIIGRAYSIVWRNLSQLKPVLE